MDFLDAFNASMETACRPEVQRQPWMQDVSMELVTADTIERVVDECIESGVYGFDLETSGLDNRMFEGRESRAQIVGYCLSPDGVRGYYAPVRHRRGTEHNISIPIANRAIGRLSRSSAVAVFHNAKFDQEFLYGADLGVWDNPKQFDDTLILAWLRNTRQKSIGLKTMAAQVLGRKMIELRELFPSDFSGHLDFSELDPSWEPCVWYACSDAINTYLLRGKLLPEVVSPSDGSRGQGTVYNIEKMCLPATRWMERNRVFVQQEKVVELMRLGQQEMFDCLKEIYSFCNEALGRSVEPAWFRLLRESFTATDVQYDINQQIETCRARASSKRMDPLDEDGHYQRLAKRVELDVAGKLERFESFPERYDVLSRTQLGELFCELQIPDLVRTGKSGQIRTTQEDIDELERKHGANFPFLPRIKRLGELQRAIGAYLISMARDVGPDGTLKVNYNQCGTETGRFTTPASSDPSADGGTKFPIHGTPATYDKKRPECLLRIREVFGARRKTSTIVSIDYGGVELRIATFLSGEPLWLKEYFRCSTCGQEFDAGDGSETPEPPPAYCPKCGDDRIGDLHTLTGITFYGEEAVGDKQWKQKRNNAKAANFSLVFGGGPSAIMRATGCDEMDAARHHRSFNTTFGGLKAWWDQTKAFGRSHGYVLTDFGRRYPIPDILLPTDEVGVREFLVANDVQRFAYRIYKQLHRNMKIKANALPFEKFTYEEGTKPQKAAAKFVLNEYRAEILIGNKRDITDDELKRRIVESVVKAEAAVVREQVNRHKGFKAKAERNATNGPIQGTSVDITKIAMALIYKECRKRNWLDKARLIITIHDELVFDIDDDILVEAIECFKRLMARNDVILAKRWRVPLTTDCEIGFDWTVPFNVNDFKFKRVRADGVQLDARGEPSGKVWPEKFVKIFGPVYGFAGDAPKTAAEDGPLPVPSVPEPLRSAVEEQGFVQPEVAPVQGGSYTYEVRFMSVGSACALAQVIVKCKDRGTNRLSVRGPGGEDLLWPGATVYVNPIEFERLADIVGV